MSQPDFDYRNFIHNHFQPKASRKQAVLLFILMLVLFAGFYYFSIHQNKPQYVLPPRYNTENQTFDKVLAFIQSDNTDKIPYGEGFNCVDYVFRVWRNADWAGIKAFPIAIQYEDPPGHMVIGFQTTDKRAVFFETENDQQIWPMVGGSYDGRKIRGLYLLDLTPIPLANSPEYDPSIVIK